MKVLKISRNLILVFSIMGICALNMVSFFDNGQNTDVNLNQLMIRNAKASEDPNIHYGYIKDFDNNCCKRRYHDDECKGSFC